MEETDWSKIAKVMNDMASARMWIDDSPTLSVLELRTKTRRLEVEQQGLDLVIVDYLQLMQASSLPRDPNRVQEVSEISRGLKNLARELKVPVLALRQLSRNVEQRGGSRSRACRTCASPVRSSRTRTSSSSCTGRSRSPTLMRTSSWSRPRSPSTATDPSVRSASVPTNADQVLLGGGSRRGRSHVLGFRTLARRGIIGGWYVRNLKERQACVHRQDHRVP